MRIEQKFYFLLSSLILSASLGSCVSDNMPSEMPVDDPTLYLTKKVNLQPENLSDTIYISFEHNQSFHLTADSAKMNPSWDVAFTKGNGFTNELGDRSVKIYTLNETNFDDLSEYVSDFSEDSTLWKGNDKDAYVSDFSEEEESYYRGSFNRALCLWFTPTEYGKAFPSMRIDNRIRIIKTMDGRYVKFQFDNIYQDPENHTGYGNVQLKYAYLKSVKSPFKSIADSTYLLSSKPKQALSTLFAGKDMSGIKKLTITTSVTQDDVTLLKSSFKGLKELDLTDARMDVNPHLDPFLKSNTQCPLKSVIMPKSMKIIGIGWLAYCKDLEEVIIPGDSLVQVMNGAFTYSKKLKKIVLPNSVLSIEHNAFSFSGLEMFTIPPKVMDIEYGTFYGCKNLKEVVVPASVKLIGGRAFSLCSNLEKIKFLGQTPPEINDVFYYSMSSTPHHEYPFSTVPWDKNGQPFIQYIVPQGKISEYMTSLKMDPQDRVYFHESNE